MKKWYKSKIIWTGIVAVLTAIYAGFESGMDWKASLLAGFGALVIFLRSITWEEIQKLMLFAILFVYVAACSKLPLPKGQQADIAIQTACATIAIGDCFGEPALQSVFNGINADNCVNRIKNKEFIFSARDIRNLRKPSCGKAFKGLGL